MMEQRIRHMATEVKHALAELIARGMVLEQIGRDGRIHYGLNRRKRATVAQLLKAVSTSSQDVPHESTSG
jgi:hypothetical protein